MGNNDEFIKKAVLGSSFLNGGELNARQRDVFLMFVRKFTRLIPMARTEIMENPKLEIAKLHIGEPVTVALVDNGLIAETGTPKFNEITLDTKETVSRFEVTRRAVRRNVAKGRILNQITTAFMQQMATDLENLFINGDDSLGAGSPINNLLRIDDGLDVKTDAAHIVDWLGDFVNKTMFAKMIRSLPDSYSDDPGLKFFLPRALQVDWVELNSQRTDAIGERAFKGNVEAPFAVPIVQIPLMPSRKDVSVTIATAGHHLGTTQGPWTIVTGVNDTLSFNIGGGAKVVTLPAGVFAAHDIAALIKATAGLSTLIVQDDGFGRLYVEHPTTGVANSVIIGAGNANATLGFTAATYTGQDAGVASNIKDGCICWLANPLNFIWGNLDRTEIYTEFNKNYVRWETVMVNEVDTEVESLDKIVKAINIRRRPY